MSAEVLGRFARGELDDARLSEVLEHLETCEACARAGQSYAAGDLEKLRSGWSSEPRGAAGSQPAGILAGMSRAPGGLRAHRSTGPWLFAAAAAIAIAVLSALLFPRERPAPRDPVRTVAVPRPAKMVPLPPSKTATAAEERYANPEWQEAITRTLARGRLPFPADLDELTAPADTVRGGTGANEQVRPAGVVIEAVRPVFTWPAREGGTYTVFIFDDDRELMKSPPLQRTRWVPDRDLPRGRTLTWQVEVTGTDAFETIPSPPSPPAMFRIVKDADHRELIEARERHPDDHLLLAVLHARSGMRAEALAALRRAAAGNEAAKRILDHETSTAP